jgi:glycosyltransferase involved in cell wall biosynthesis
MKKKLLLVTTVPETLYTILKSQPTFLQEHFDVYLTSSAGSFCKQVEVHEGMPVNIVPMVRGIHPFYDLFSVFMMVRLLLKLKPDAVHSYTPKAGLITMLSSWLCRVPIRIHTFTGLIFPTSQGLRQKLLMQVDRLICACATRIVPEGKGIKQDLIRFKITKKQMSVIGHGNIAGVDLRYFTPNVWKEISEKEEFKISLGIGKNSFVFIFVGRLNRDKGLDELAQAFADMPAECHLLIVGELDSSAPLKEKTLTFFQQNPRVHVLGFVEDIRLFLAASDVLVLPSHREGFPNVVLQAGAMELPVIASDINGCNEVIEQGKNGWLVRPGDSQSLKQAMREAFCTKTLDAMGTHARKIVAMKFERQRYWQHLKSFYDQEIYL